MLCRERPRRWAISAAVSHSSSVCTRTTRIPAPAPSMLRIADSTAASAVGAWRWNTACGPASSVPKVATLANFALFDLVGKQLSPRIRDLGKITLYRTGAKADFLARYPRCGPLLTRRLNTDLITGMGDDLLRVAASVHGGTPPPPWWSGSCARANASRTR